MKKLLVLRGMPGSGKSTFAKKLVADDPTWKRVNRDDLRIMSGYHFEPRTVKVLNVLIDSIVRNLLTEGFNVVVDNTNLEGWHTKNLHLIAQDIGDVEVTEKCFTTPLDECKRRNALREGLARVPDEVMDSFAKLAKRAKLVDKTVQYPPRPSGARTQAEGMNLPKAVICDLDGTLAVLNGRSPYNAEDCDVTDTPNLAVVECLKCMFFNDRTIIFTSGREDKFREPTMRFLEKHCGFLFSSGVQRFHLYMRQTGDSRRDSIVKKEMYEASIKDKFYVDFVLDDRNQVVDLWRSLGLPCFQVAPGAF